MHISQIALLLVLLLFPSHVLGQVCSPTQKALESLKADPIFEESEFLGFTGSNNVAQLFVNKVTGSWSFVVSYPNGRTCLFFSGTEYLRLRNEEPPAPQQETRKGT